VVETRDFWGTCPFCRTVKTLKRIILVLLALLVLAQIPFIYRRYQTGKLADKIAQLDAQRATYTDPNFKEYKGIIHAHTNLGGHSTGSFEELIAAANANDLDFVLMTEHYSDTFDTAAQTLNGVHGKALFVGGNEIDTSDGDRFLLFPGGGEAARARMSGTAAFLEKAHAENKLALITYPEKFKSWDSAFDGIEVLSLHTAAKQMNWLMTLGDLIWSYPSYPELTLTKNFQRPHGNLAKFDEIAAQRKISLFAGTDAHSNIGFHLFGDDANNKLINVKLDPYATIFQLARLHVMTLRDQPFDSPDLIKSIQAGNYFVGLDALGDTSGFLFAGSTNQGTVIMGHTVSASHGLQLIAKSPIPARLVLLKDGTVVSESRNANELSRVPQGMGAYRVEVYRDDLGPPFDKIPWIMSNPIYVR
jgi:hypothetical protein